MSGRERIVRGAFELFSEKGFSAVGIREIAERAGLSNPAIYQHFDSKEHLGRDVYERCYQELLDAVEEKTLSADEPIHWLNGYIEAAVALHGKRPSPLLFLDSEQRTFFDHVEAIYGAKIISAQVMRQIEAGQRSGTFGSQSSPRLLTAAIVGMLSKWAAMTELGLAPVRGAASGLKEVMRATLVVTNYNTKERQP